MKKPGRLISVVILAALVLSCVPPASAADTGAVNISAAGAFLMDFETGEELYSYNADVARVPASMTKVMSLYIMYEAVENGEIALDDKVPISARVYQLSRNTSYINTLPLHYDQTYTVDEMLDIITVYSASACVVAMAELISGSEEAFIERMNAKATEMGLNASYVCSAGLGMNYISPRSMAALARSIILDYPDILNRSAKKSVSFHGKTYNSTNLLLGSMYYEGADGLKTGTTSAAGYCFCGTAQRDSVRLITVVMSSSSTTQRYTDTQRLLNYGFAMRDSIINGSQPEPEPEPEPEPSGPFRDVPDSAWYTPGVMFVWQNGLMKGTSEDTFSPNAPLTRAQVVTVFYRMAMEPEVPQTQIFPDVPLGEWYSDAVSWAYHAGMVIGGGEGEYKPDEVVSREEFVVILYQFAALLGYDVSVRAELDKYVDEPEISVWALSAMQWAVGAGLIKGTTEATLSPKAELSRAQCASLLTSAILGTQSA